MKKILLLILLPIILYASYQRKIFPSANRMSDSVKEVTVLVEFINSNPYSVRGLVYSEQIETNIQVVPISVKINDRTINAIRETGSVNEVYLGCVPYRWILEEPPFFPQNVPILPNDTLKITYSLQCDDNLVIEYNKDAVYGILDDNVDTLSWYAKEISELSIYYEDGSCFFVYDDTTRNIAFGNDVTLPVHSFSLSYQIMQNSIFLAWDVVGEYNNVGYNIFKSIDGSSYELLSSYKTNPCLRSVNNIERVSYSYEDKNIKTGTFYYKIISTDYNGVETSFNPIRVEIIKDSDIKIYPNPFTTEFKLQLPSDNLDIVIYDILGRRIDKIVDKKYNASKLSAGMYFLVISKGSVFINKKLLKI